MKGSGSRLRPKFNRPGGQPVLIRVNAARSLASGAGPFEHDLDAAVLRAALRRLVRGDRMGVAEALGRDDVGVDALRGQIGDDVAGSARGQVDVIGNTRPLQAGSNQLVVCIAIDDDLGVLQMFAAAGRID